MSTPSVLRTPNFVKARSPKRLRVLMLEVQARLGVEFNPNALTIVYQPDEKVWYCWYPDVIEIDQIEGEIVDGN